MLVLSYLELGGRVCTVIANSRALAFRGLSLCGPSTEGILTFQK